MSCHPAQSSFTILTQILPICVAVSSCSSLLHWPSSILFLFSSRGTLSLAWASVANAIGVSISCVDWVGWAVRQWCAYLWSLTYLCHFVVGIDTCCPCASPSTVLTGCFRKFHLPALQVAYQIAAAIYRVSQWPPNDPPEDMRRMDSANASQIAQGDAPSWHSAVLHRFPHKSGDPQAFRSILYLVIGWRPYLNQRRPHLWAVDADDWQW